MFPQLGFYCFCVDGVVYHLEMTSTSQNSSLPLWYLHFIPVVKDAKKAETH